MLFSRPDGEPCNDVPATRRIMPFIMRTRNEAAVYFEQRIDLTETLRFIEAFNASHPDKKVTVFHVFLWAALHAIHERPRLNRFVMGGKLWQRKGIWISFSAKKALRDDAPIVVLKRLFEPPMSFEALVDQVLGDVRVGKSDQRSHVDKELSLFLRMPGFLLRWAVNLLRWLDDWNLLPNAFIGPDPLYASLFVANLGSVRLDSAYHHLYEYGTIPIFAVIGRTEKTTTLDEDGKPVTRPTCSIKYSLDERVEDGLYCARALELLRDKLEHPAGWGAARGEITGS